MFTVTAQLLGFGYFGVIADFVDTWLACGHGCGFTDVESEAVAMVDKASWLRLAQLVGLLDCLHCVSWILLSG
jgi:hypothetical protein